MTAKSGIVVVARLTAKPGEEDAAAQTVKEMVEWVSANEPGTLAYSAHRSKKEPGQILFYEIYRDDDARQAHRGSDAFKNFGRKIVNHIDTSATTIEEFELIAGVERGDAGS
ncbi:MAG: antibiotic biosynthesis monooxygenase [Dehalococcoidia bacterium]|nr:antibiotic biosynthesis monooxygenase [Dehalococcoidia bacterium]